MDAPIRGNKLDRDGQFQWFPGCTFISDLDDAAMLKFAKRVQRAVSKSSFASCYAMLPLDSMHCTIYDLFTEYRTSNWPKGLKVNFCFYFHSYCPSLSFNN